MSEFVEGFEKMTKIGPCVSIFGSARTKPDNPYYKLAEEIATRMTLEGYGVITGGGPGIMEAANKGAKAGKGKSVGLNIRLPFEQSSNIYVDIDKNINFDYFFIRKTIFLKYSQGFIAMPGGFGTLDEFSEVATLVQTGRIPKFPLILIGKKFWSGLMAWMKEQMQERRELISPNDLDLFHIVETPAQAMKI
ncbi:MAG TPA: TIGR00730 family Rossman fold protein, partial [Bacteroidia bacterium]|nr:TIGR00730 family Rossman fold protein [Bacteroidia bacterium]